MPSHLCIGSIVAAVLTKSRLNISFTVKEAGLERGGDLPSPPRWAVSLVVHRDPASAPHPQLWDKIKSHFFLGQGPWKQPTARTCVHVEEVAREEGEGGGQTELRMGSGKQLWPDPCRVRGLWIINPTAELSPLEEKASSFGAPISVTHWFQATPWAAGLTRRGRRFLFNQGQFSRGSSRSHKCPIFTAAGEWVSPSKGDMGRAPIPSTQLPPPGNKVALPLIQTRAVTTQSQKAG